MPDAPPYDVIVVGAGLSGLAAGIRLAQYDQRVVLLERHYLWGGLNSFYRKDGHRFDTGLHALTNFARRGALTANQLPLAEAERFEALAAAMMRRLEERHIRLGADDAWHRVVLQCDQEGHEAAALQVAGALEVEQVEQRRGQVDALRVRGASAALWQHAREREDERHPE